MLRTTTFIIRTSLLLCCALVVPTILAQEDKPIVAIVIQIKGRLEWRASDRGRWQAATLGQKLLAGTHLRTGNLDRAVIVFVADASRVLINEQTELVVEAKGQFIPKAKSRIRMLAGEVFNKIRSGHTFEVETPSSVASVRGTDFDVLYDVLVQRTTVTVVDGVVWLADLLGRWEVQAGANMRTTHQEGAPPSKPAPLPQSEVQRITRWTEQMAPKWELNLVPEGGGTQEVGTSFKVKVGVSDAQTGHLDPTAQITSDPLSTDLPQTVFSTDGGATWSTSLRVVLSNGTGEVLVRGEQAGTLHLAITARDCAPGEATITLSPPKERHRLELDFEGEDGGKKKAIIELEDK